MRVLVINCGSSSLKADVIESTTGERICHQRVERLTGGHAAALQSLWPALMAAGPLEAVGHRVAHGGARFSQPVRIDDSVEKSIDELSELAPLHNPAHVAGIRAARALLPNIPHIAVFDTAFHNTLPRRAYTYALPAALAEKHNLRRYGFHGTSHAWVAAQAASYLRSDLRDLRIITCHLGSGASICAIEYGRSVETSMGMTPLEGLVMATRSGDVDPGLLLSLQKKEGLDAAGMEKLLNQQSGLAGLAGTSGDMRDIEERAAAGDAQARLAIHLMTHRLRKYIGAYAAVMGGVDAIVFTAGIGENSALVRHRAAQRLEFLGARLDEDANRDAKVSHAAPVADISEAGSRVRLLVVATDEERAIAQATARLASSADVVEQKMLIPIAVSARHIHLTRSAIDTLFGPGYQLTPIYDLSQPGQYACAEQLTLVGPRHNIPGVRILGPERPESQVEISRTDEFVLGVDAPIRDSGDVRNSPGITLQGPKGSLTLREGLICARRHIHMHPDDARRFGVKDRDVVEIAIDSEGRDLIFGDVLVRVSDKFRLEMHVDTDEANAAQLQKGATGMLEASGHDARLLRRKTAYDDV